MRLVTRDPLVAAGLLGAVVAGVAGVVCTIVWLELLASAVDRVFLGDASLRDVRPALFTMVVLLVLRGGSGWVAEVLGDRASGRLRTNVRRELVDHLFAVGPGGMSHERTGEVASTIGTGVEALHESTTRFLPAAALAVVGPGLVFGAVFLLDPWTTLVLAFTGPMLVLLLAVIGGRTRVLTQRRLDELGWLSAFYLDMIRGLGTLKAFRRSADGADTIEDVSRSFGDATMEVLRTAFQTSLVMEWAATAATALVAVEVSFRLIGGEIPFGTALAVLVLVPEFFAPFRRLALEYHSGQEGRAALERIDELLALPAMTTPATTAVASAGKLVTPPVVAPALVLPPSIEFSEVAYTYPGATSPALECINLHVAAGETVALVGPSGGGKTTLSRVLLRFIDPDRGGVLIDGRAIADLDLAAWRQSIAWVPQDPTLVAGTVSDNIRLGDPDASDERVQAAAETARAADFVSRLPQGFDTVLGERGLRLSGGQRQRLAIARAVLRDAPVVVLDEFTAHLDDRTEDELLEVIERLLIGRTAVVIAHRERTVAMADRVATLADGHIASSDGAGP